MRTTSVFLALAFALVSPAALQAIPVSQGKIVQGRYEVSGRSSTAGVSITYRASAVRITNHGRITGKVYRQVTSQGRVLQDILMKIHGTVRAVKVRARKGTFTAEAVVRIGPGAAFRGQFVGLTDRSLRKSRFFHGKLSGNKHSNLTLRSR